MKKFKKMSLSFKTVVSCLIMVFLMSAAIVFLTYRIFSSTINAEYGKSATHLAETVSISLDSDSVKRLEKKVMDIYNKVVERVGAEYTGSAEYAEYIAHYSSILHNIDYKNNYAKLEEIREANEVESIYIVSIDPTNKKVIYLADGSVSPCAPGNFDPLFDENAIVLTNPEHGFSAYITNTPEYGWLITAGAPIYDSKGNVIAYSCVDLSMNEIRAQEWLFMLLLIVVAVLAGLLFGIIYIIFISKAIVRPINSLSDAALSYANSDDKNVFQNLDIKTGDEIENLADAMKKMENDIKTYIENITNITAEKERIGAELNVATQIQADMLPRIFPSFPDKHEFELFAAMDPAKEVGGDFYDFFLVDDEHLGLVVADVSGKGVPAALFMVIAKTLIKNRAILGGSPSEILSYANEQLCEGNDAELFVTVWFAIIDIKTGKGIAANAGHEHPALRRAGGDYELVIYKHSPALATIPGMKFKEHEFELHHGDTLLCYTDGVTEATNKNNELYGNDRLIKTLNTNPEADVYGVINGVRHDIDRFVGDAPQFDDITMLCFYFK